MFEWMAWTTPVAVFFVCIALMLTGMTLWEIRSPTVLRNCIRCWSMSNSRRRCSSLRTMLWIQKKLARRWPRVTGSTRCTLVPG